MISRLRLGICGFLMLSLSFSGLVQASAVSNEDKAEVTEVTAHVIEIRDFVFSPLSVEIKTGDTITWTNFDIVPHTATAIDNSWDSGTLKQGESSTFTATDDMQLDYFIRYEGKSDSQKVRIMPPHPVVASVLWLYNIFIEAK